MIEYVLTDEQVNDMIDELLDWSVDKRRGSPAVWSARFDKAMTQWDEMHSGTRPPAYAKIGPPPACFKGQVPPIYEGELGNTTVSCNK